MPPTSIAIVGGGITGLSSAFHLSRRFPQAQIRVFEKSRREGGWIRSQRVDVQGYNGEKASVLLESGPRTLRPNSGAVLELINLLGLHESVITAAKSSAAAKHRYLHIPGRRGLTRIPSSPLGLLTSPYITSLLGTRILYEALRGSNRPKGEDDESLSSFLTRRFGHKFERIFGSALVHGIYAADARLLSVKAAFPTLLQAEERGNGSLVRGMLKANSQNSEPFAGYDVGDIPALVKDAAVFSFIDGMETLVGALTKHVQSTSNVTVSDDANVLSLRPSDSSSSVELKLANGELSTASHVVSAISLPNLKKLTAEAPVLLHLTANPSSSVTVINLVFPPTSRPVHPPGFGYLIPRSRMGYTSRTSGFLGAVFDSCAMPQQDRGAPGFTRMTVMVGGPHAPALTSAHSKPENVMAQLQLHLAPRGPKLPWPVHYEAVEHRDCIPTPTVGHVERMTELKQVLKEGAWKGRLEVVGAGVGGVSVGDCVEAGRNVGRDW